MSPDNPSVKWQAPDQPPKLQPGRTAMWWVRRSVVASTLGGLLVALMTAVVYGMPLGHTRTALLVLIAVLGGVVGLALVLIGVGWATANRREAAAGYTTVYDRQRVALWQLDPASGAVIRRPG